MMMSLFFPNMLQTDKDLYFLSLIAEFGIWGHILLVVCHITPKMEKRAIDQVMTISSI